QRPQALIDVIRYYSESSFDHWVTSGLPVRSVTADNPTPNPYEYLEEGVLGGAFTSGGDGLVEIDDCVSIANKALGGNDHVVTYSSQCVAGSGYRLLRRIGWIYSPSLPQPPGTVPFYRCYISSTIDHFVSIDPNCEGASV